MQRSLVLALVLLAAAVIGGIWIWSRGDAPPPRPPGGPVIDEPVDLGPATAVESGTTRSEPGAAPVREAVARGDGELLADPDIRAGLCGFKGRVVSHLKVPVADCGVRIYRGALDSILQMKGDLFAEITDDFEPQYIAGEVRTKDDGTFEVTGVWPGGFYLLFAGIDTEAPTHMVVTKTPAPGQLIDLGDVVLNDAGVITGTVYDDEGEPLAGALVRAADIPGALAAFIPLERFDPEGAVLIRGDELPVSVLQMPPWVKRAFEHLPIPMTRTAADGTFRLVGVVPGSNMLATTYRGFLSDVKPSVQVRSGRERDVGRIRMRRGEELYAQVLDEKGEPVAGAEVVAGSTLSMVPLDLGQNLGTTDEEGRIVGTGFSAGKVTVAARRSPQHAWVLADPQRIINDVIVTLPAAFSARVSVQLSDGTPAKQPKMRLLRGRKGDGAAELMMMGMVKPVSLEGRLVEVDEGQWRIDELLAGEYTLLAEVPGQATGAESFELSDQDAAVTVKLAVPKTFLVRVVDQQQQPIKNAAIFAEARGDRVVEMPVRCGRTDKEGRLTIDKLQAEKLRVSADHPRWGVVHGNAEMGKELVMQMLPPGSLRGRLSDNGKAPLPGEYTVAVTRRNKGGPRGPLDQVPTLVTANADGVFEVATIQPGYYSVRAVSSLDALRSPGGMFSLTQSMYLYSRLSSERVDVLSGQVTELTLEVGERPLEGPTAQLTGSVTVDGRLAEGYTVTAFIDGRRFAAIVDARGRFDVGMILAGSVYVTVLGGSSVWMGPQASNIYSARLALKEARFAS